MILLTIVQRSLTKITFAIRIAFAAQSIRHCRNLQASRIAFSYFRFSLLGMMQSRRVFLRFCLATHDRQEKTPSKQASKQATRYRRKRVKFARRFPQDSDEERQRGVGSSRRKDRASYEIRLSYPPTPTAARRFWRRRQPPNADTMVDSCCRRFLRVAFLRCAAPHRVEHVGPAGFLLRARRRHEKNVARDRRAPVKGATWP